MSGEGAAEGPDARAAAPAGAAGAEPGPQASRPDASGATETEPGRRLWPLYAVGFVTAFGAHSVAANLGSYDPRASLLALGVLLAVYDGAEVVLKPGVRGAGRPDRTTPGAARRVDRVRRGVGGVRARRRPHLARGLGSSGRRRAGPAPRSRPAATPWPGRDRPEPGGEASDGAPAAGENAAAAAP